MTEVVAMSGGKDSTALALELKARNTGVNYQYVITPTGDELPPMKDHWRELEIMLGKPMIRLQPIGLIDLIHEQHMIPNSRARFCTRIIKIEPFIEYMRSLPDGSVWHVGLRADEEQREGVEIKSDNFTIRYPLREWGWRMKEVTDCLSRHGVEIPKRTDCGCCFYQRLHEWHELFTNYPKRYQEYVDIEGQYGFTFRSPSRDTQPTSLELLMAKFKSGYIPTKRKSTMKTACPFCSR